MCLALDGTSGTATAVTALEQVQRPRQLHQGSTVRVLQQYMLRPRGLLRHCREHDKAARPRCWPPVVVSHSFATLLFALLLRLALEGARLRPRPLECKQQQCLSEYGFGFALALPLPASATCNANCHAVYSNDNSESPCDSRSFFESHYISADPISMFLFFLFFFFPDKGATEAH